MWVGRFARRGEERAGGMRARGGGEGRAERGGREVPTGRSRALKVPPKAACFLFAGVVCVSVHLVQKTEIVSGNYQCIPTQITKSCMTQ